MDKGYVLDCVRSFAREATRMLDIQQVILFGSYARGTATDISDIDVAVVAARPVSDWLSVSADLFRIGRRIDLAIEPVLIDSPRDPSGFLAEIRRTGEVIYDRDKGDQ